MPLALAKALPHSEETERAVLAALLLKPDSLDEIFLLENDFYLERHRLLYGAITTLAGEGIPIDVRTVQAHLEQLGRFDDAGGAAYLVGLDLDLPDLGRLVTYAAIVKDNARRRRLIELGMHLARTASGESAPVEVASYYRRRLEDVESGTDTEFATRAGGELLAQVLDDARARQEQRAETGEPVFGIKTGLLPLDRLLCGLQQGLYLLAGPPGGGKTSLATQIALHAAQQGPVVYASFENSPGNLLLKILTAHAGLRAVDVERGFVELEPLYEAAKHLKPTLDRLDLVDADGTLTVGRLRALARRAVERSSSSGAPPLIVIDYLQLWAKVSREMRSLTDVRAKVDSLGGDLIALSKHLEAPVLAIASQNRASGSYGGGGGRAALDSLKESGDLEYAARVAMFLTSEDPEEAASPKAARSLTLAIRKNRFGPTGDVKLVFAPETGTFRVEAHQAAM